MVKNEGKEEKWSGREVDNYDGPLSEVRQRIPSFKRENFAMEDGGENRYRDLIIREPLNIDSDYIRDRVHIPIKSVSKRYDLFQHQDFFDALVAALGPIVPDAQSLDPELKITEYGERMWVNFTLPNYRLNESENYPIVLVVNGLNSVDATTSLDVKLSWYDTTSNIRIPYGMVSGYWKQVNFRKKHLKGIGKGIGEFSAEIRGFLTSSLRRLTTERSRYKRWVEASVSWEQLVGWIDNDLKKKWGLGSAVRAYHIAKIGRDVQVKTLDKEANIKPSELEVVLANEVSYDFAPVKPVKVVLGNKVHHDFAPVQNAFHVSQVLGWIASQQGTIPGQLKWMDILSLMEALLKREKRLALSIGG